MTTVSSVAEFVQQITELDHSLIRDGGPNNETLLFRGQSNKAFDLLPSIARGRKFACDISIFSEERNMIEMAKYKLPMSLMIRFPQSNYWRFCSTTESQPAFWTLRKMLWSLCILPAPEMQERMAKLLYSRQTSWMWRIIQSSTLLQTATDLLGLHSCN